MNRTDVLKSWADQWRTLRAWGRNLEEVTFTFKPHRRGPLGSACSVTRDAEIRETHDLADDLATILHELAHLAVPGCEQHGTRWRVAFSAAVKEVTGGVVADAEIHLIDRQARDYVKQWLTASGQAAVLRALNIKVA